MDLFPLWNSLRIALISTVLIFFLGILAAYYIARLPRVLKGILDVVLTLPLVLPPTVVGYLLLRLLGPKRIIGAWLLKQFGIKVVMTWWSAIFATAVVIFPLAGADALLPAGHSCRHGAGLCPGTGRIWRHQYDCRVHPRPHRYHLHHRLPTLADE